MELRNYSCFQTSSGTGQVECNFPDYLANVKYFEEVKEGGSVDSLTDFVILFDYKLLGESAATLAGRILFENLQEQDVVVNVYVYNKNDEKVLVDNFLISQDTDRIIIPFDTFDNFFIEAKGKFDYTLYYLKSSDNVLIVKPQIEGG